jgi:predicted nuclease with TOPRIM domain
MDIESNQWYRPVLYLRWLDKQGGQLFADTEKVTNGYLSGEEVLPNTEVLERQMSSNQLSLSQRLEKESLEKDLAARQQDYEGVADKLRWETNPIEQNSLQAKLDKLIDKIKQLEQRLKQLK